MHSRNLPQDRAFDFLVDISQRLNVKLRQVAEIIVDTGAIPGSVGNDRA